MKDIKLKYWSHKTKAKHRGIDFNLTFEQWWDIWQQSGKWEQRGCRKGQYVMSRYKDMGPYAIGNVFIQSTEDNRKDSHLGNNWNKGKTYSRDRVEKARASFIANKKAKEHSNG